MSLRSNARSAASKPLAAKPNVKSAALTSVRQFQSEVAAFREAPEPRSARVTVHALGMLVLASLLATALLRVDRVVTSTAGQIVTKEPETVFQALDPSIIKSIDVKEGQRVAKGQLLATLDPTFAAATVNQLKAQIDSLKTQIVRDQAELAGGDLVFPPSREPSSGKYQKVQKELFDQQMANYKAQVQSFDQKIAMTDVTVKKYKADEGRYKDEGNIAKQVEDMWSTLQNHGNGSLLSLLSATNSKLESLRQMEYDHNSVIENEHALASLQADRAAFIQQFRSTTTQDLVTQRNALDTAMAQLDAALKHQDVVRLVAPQDSTVLSVVKLSVGSVLKSGDPLMTLTPIDAPLDVELRVSTGDVGFLRPGDPVELKIDAFNSAEHGAVKGKLSSISEDVYTTDDNGKPLPSNSPPYYKVRVAITEVNLINVPPTFRLIPGMTLVGDIRVGTRPLGMYMLGGMMRTVGNGMREP